MSNYVEKLINSYLYDSPSGSYTAVSVDMLDAIDDRFAPTTDLLSHMQQLNAMTHDTGERSQNIMEELAHHALQFDKECFAALKDMARHVYNLENLIVGCELLLLLVLFISIATVTFTVRAHQRAVVQDPTEVVVVDKTAVEKPIQTAEPVLP